MQHLDHPLFVQYVSCLYYMYMSWLWRYEEEEEEEEMTVVWQLTERLQSQRSLFKAAFQCLKHNSVKQLDAFDTSEHFQLCFGSKGRYFMQKYDLYVTLTKWFLCLTPTRPYLTWIRRLLGFIPWLVCQISMYQSCQVERVPVKGVIKDPITLTLGSC